MLGMSLAEALLNIQRSLFANKVGLKFGVISSMTDLRFQVDLVRTQSLMSYIDLRETLLKLYLLLLETDSKSSRCLRAAVFVKVYLSCSIRTFLRIFAQLRSEKSCSWERNPLRLLTDRFRRISCGHDVQSSETSCKSCCSTLMIF